MPARPLSSRSPLALAALLLLAGCAGEEPPRPNVLLLSVDSLRADHVSAYGRVNPLAPGVATTPAAFDRLAREGVLFENAVTTTSWTLPSHMALMTGLPDPLHGVTDNTKRLAEGFETLAGFLSARGWATGGFFNGPYLHPAFGFGHGFDVYEDHAGIDQPIEVFESDVPGRLMDVHRASHQAVTSPSLLRAASEWIRARSAEPDPWFAFVHWWDPHYDYLAPERVEQRFVDGYEGRYRGVHRTESHVRPEERDIQHLRSLYDAEIRWTDEHLGELLDLLDELGVADDTIVVLTSDHGEEFWEHTRWGHQTTLFEDVVRIPMLVRYPRAVPAGVRAGGQARIQDVFPTVAELIELAPPTYLEGTSLAPLWRDPEARGEPQVLRLRVPMRDVDLVGLRLARKKAVLDLTDGRARVYDLDTPGEEPEIHETRRPRESQRFAIVKLLEKLTELDAMERDLPAEPGAPIEDLPDALLESLRAHGYMGEDAPSDEGR
jgi:arylsulfatase A-like enzyme